MHQLTSFSGSGALIIRIRFWGPLYCNYNKEPPKWYWYLFKPLCYDYKHWCLEHPAPPWPTSCAVGPLGESAHLPVVPAVRAHKVRHLLYLDGSIVVFVVHIQNPIR